MNSNTKTRFTAPAVALGGAASALVGTASAQAAGGIDTGVILAAIAAAGAAGLLCYGAYAAARWAIKALRAVL